MEASINTTPISKLFQRDNTSISQLFRKDIAPISELFQKEEYSTINILENLTNSLAKLIPKEDE